MLTSLTVRVLRYASDDRNTEREMARSQAGKRERDRLLLWETELVEAALEDRGGSREFLIREKREVRNNNNNNNNGNNRARSYYSDRGRYERYASYGLIPVHRDLESWIFVSEDPQLATAIEEIVNTFSPGLSIELLLYSVLGSNSESATCLIRYLVEYYTGDHVRGHIKNALRNMIRWSVLAGFVPCVFVPWKKLRTFGPGLSGNATVASLVRSRLRGDHSDPGTKRGTRLDRGESRRGGARESSDLSARTGKGADRPACLSTVPFGLSRADAAREALQEREAHERALPSVLGVPLARLADTLKLLMSNSVPETPASVVCKIVRDWVERDEELAQDPVKDTELKMASVGLWGVMKTFEHGRCPVVPECKASGCLAFYDAETDLVTVAVDGVLYRRVPALDSCWAREATPCSLAKRAHSTVKGWARLFGEMSSGLAASCARQVYTCAGTNRSSLTHLADVMLSSREEQQRAGLSVAGNSFGKPLLDNLSRFLASERPGMFGLNAAELPDLFLASGAGTTFSEHKSASVSHSLSKMMSSMVSEGKEVLLLRRFFSEVTRYPRLALETLRNDCEDPGLLRMAETVSAQLDRVAKARGLDEPKPGGDVTELGPEVKLVCNYPCSVTVAHLEETLSMWTNFWRSNLSGFCQFNRRHNTIQYNNRDTVRELESGSPVHVFHSALVTLLNTSGVTFADSLTGRKPDASLTVSEIMLTRDSLHPTSYGLLLSNKLGLRPSDVKERKPAFGESTCL